MFKLWSLTRKRSTPAQLLGTEYSIRISGFSLASDGSDEPNVSLEFWADDKRYVLQIPLDKVDSVCERMRESKTRVGYSLHKSSNQLYPNAARMSKHA